MYKIIGGDHKEYGPVSADEIRRWLAEGRLNGQSLIRLDSGTEWKPLASFPEFAPDFNAGAQPPQLPAGVPQAPQAFTAQILAGAPEVEVFSCLERSFKLLSGNFIVLYSSVFIVWIIGLGAAQVPFLGP